MLTLTEIFSILIIHFIADFVFQDEKWALGKSKNMHDLIDHTAMYSTIWLFVGILLATFSDVTIPQKDEMFYKSFVFWFITFAAHTATDYVTSRVVAKKFAAKKYGSAIPNFGAFTMIGFDQILHYIQLFLTYYLLTK